MLNDLVKVDTNSIKGTKKMMDDNYNAIVDMVSKYKDKIEETKKIYDTESGDIYRIIATGYLDIMQKYLNSDFKEYIDTLDDIVNTYIGEFNDTQRSIDGGDFQ